MEVIRAADYDELSVCAAEMIIQTVKSKNDAVLGLATGSTPIGTYKRLIEAYRQGRVSFAAAKSINLDEYVGLGENDPNSYRRFMNDMFFNNIDIDVRNTYVPDGLNKNIQQECMRYDMLYKRRHDTPGLFPFSLPLLPASFFYGTDKSHLYIF